MKKSGCPQTCRSREKFELETSAGSALTHPSHVRRLISKMIEHIATSVFVRVIEEEIGRATFYSIEHATNYQVFRVVA